MSEFTTPGTDLFAFAERRFGAPRMRLERRSAAAPFVWGLDRMMLSPFNVRNDPTAFAQYVTEAHATLMGLSIACDHHRLWARAYRGFRRETSPRAGQGGQTAILFSSIEGGSDPSQRTERVVAGLRLVTPGSYTSRLTVALTHAPGREDELIAEASRTWPDVDPEVVSIDPRTTERGNDPHVGETAQEAYRRRAFYATQRVVVGMLGTVFGAQWQPDLIEGVFRYNPFA
ncbi:MAG TPA: hypothetical protein VLH84_01695 [Patescibacteria group bacterium]|nr:hypothetical protein [Patescibacteria group bacterium]